MKAFCLYPSLSVTLSLSVSLFLDLEVDVGDDGRLDVGRTHCSPEIVERQRPLTPPVREVEPLCPCLLVGDDDVEG